MKIRNPSCDRPGPGEQVHRPDIGQDDEQIGDVRPALRQKHDRMPGQRQQHHGVQPGPFAQIDDRPSKRQLDEEIGQAGRQPVQPGDHSVAVNAQR